MVEFTPGQSAIMAHRAILSSLKTREKAQKCLVLWFTEINSRQLYRELGFSSIKNYAMEKLGMSRSQFYATQQLCLGMEKLPIMKKVVASGEVDYTKAQAVLSVINKDNEKEWMEKARTTSRRDLKDLVTEAKKAAVKEAADQTAGQPSLLPLVRKSPAVALPVTVRMKMSPIQFARYEALWEKLRKMGGVSADQVEAWLEVLAVYVEGDLLTNEQGPAKKSSRLDSSNLNQSPAQIHIHKCPDCDSAVVQSSRGELQISEAEYEQAQCDCIINRPGKQNTASIAPSVRQKVLTQARHKCQRKGCNHTRFLEIHHLKPRSQGGTNELENLICLCSGCHRILHENSIVVSTFLIKEDSIPYHWGHSGGGSALINCKDISRSETISQYIRVGMFQ